MKIVIAPDSFKGALSSLKVAEAVEEGIKRVLKDAETIKVPMADGGEGTVEAMVSAAGGRICRLSVTGPLGECTDSFFGILDDNTTAVIEMAAASGLSLVPENKRNPLNTTTYGTGELIKHAVNSGCTKIIVGVGGSATNDGGMGMAQALGVKFFDKYGSELGRGGKELKKICRIDCSEMISGLDRIEFLVACDVSNPLCGPEGASYVFGPQKGAAPEMVRSLDEGLENYAKIIKKELGKDIGYLPGAGAAGGLAGGLNAFLGASIEKGVNIIITAVGLKEKIKNADIVITGEGKTDKQTFYGKVPFGIAQAAKKYDVPVVCLSGAVLDGAEGLYEYGITALFSTANKEMSLNEAMSNAAHLIKKSSENIIRLFAAGGSK